MEVNNTITITYGEQSVTHIGMKKTGNMAESGLSIDELNEAERRFSANGGKVISYDLKRLLIDCEIDEIRSLLEFTEDAKFLVIENGVDVMLKDKGGSHKDMYDEQNTLEHDRKYWDTRRKKVLNKNARGNLCFDEVGSPADLEDKHVGTVIAFKDVPWTNEVKESLPKFFGDKTKDMKAEGNYYYNKDKCGIGYHGDTERKITIGVRVGAAMPMCYQWFYKGKAVGKNLKIMIPGGGLYAMSQKSVGSDWRKSSLLTLRHSAGCDSYTKIPESKKLK